VNVWAGIWQAMKVNPLHLNEETKDRAPFFQLQPGSGPQPLAHIGLCLSCSDCGRGCHPLPSGDTPELKLEQGGSSHWPWCRG